MKERQRSHYVRASDFEYVYIPLYIHLYPPTVHQAEDARARTFHQIVIEIMREKERKRMYLEECLITIIKWNVHHCTLISLKLSI